MEQTFLDQIRQEKLADLEERKKHRSKLLRAIEVTAPPTSFADALTRKAKHAPCIIAEVKPQAPGRINAKTFNVQNVVENYETRRGMCYVGSD